MSECTKIYEQLCTHLEAAGWKFTRHDDERIVTMGMRGDDLPIELLLHVREEHVLYLHSKLPFTVPEDKRVDAAIACTAINYRLINGCFQLDIGDGELSFRMAMPYSGADLSLEQVKYMVVVASSTVDDYNDKFLMLIKDKLSIQDFISEIHK